jgi:hypothetical protein
LVAGLPEAEATLLKGVGVAAVDHDPDQFAAVAEAFLSTIDVRTGGAGAPAPQAGQQHDEHVGWSA